MIKTNKKSSQQLLDFFKKNKAEALELKYQIDATDKKIDQIVYELYDLTEKEIAVVEQVWE